jgi:hypothetical protein
MPNKLALRAGLFTSYGDRWLGHPDFRPVMEELRAITGVAFSGHAARFPDVRFIWSHAGGTAPFLAARIDGASREAKERMPSRRKCSSEPTFRRVERPPTTSRDSRAEDVL